jgi:hypothetical protein
MQPEEGIWYLEDLTSSIRLDINRCKDLPQIVFFTEGCLVIVEGFILNNIFIATVANIS